MLTWQAGQLESIPGTVVVGTNLTLGKFPSRALEQKCFTPREEWLREGDEHPVPKLA